VFEYLKAGDRVIRVLAGVIPDELTVLRVEDGRISAVPTEWVDGWNDKEEPWVFDVVTGAEVDPRFSWGPPPLSTGSYLVDVEGNRDESVTVHPPERVLVDKMLAKMENERALTGGVS
jgi:hypothetical protein